MIHFKSCLSGLSIVAACCLLTRCDELFIRDDPNLRVRHSIDLMRTKGFAPIFWDFVDSTSSKPENVSESCWSDLKIALSRPPVRSDLIKKSGHFRLDPSSGSYVEFGAYDLCLDSGINLTDNKTISSNYCLLLFLPDLGRMRRENVSKATIDELFGIDRELGIDLTIKMGFCILFSCNVSDIKTISREAIGDYYLELSDKSLCGKKTTFLDRVNGTKLLSILALLCLVSLLCLVLIAAFIERKYKKKKRKPGLFFVACEIFSPRESYNDLIYAKGNSRLNVLDNGKAIGYFIVCTIHLAAVYLPINLSGCEIFNRRLGKCCCLSLIPQWSESKTPLWVQPLANGCYWRLLMVAGGSTVAVSLSRLNTLTLAQVFNLIVKRFFVVQPLIIATACLELILPLVGSGPAHQLYSITNVNLVPKRLWLIMLHALNFQAFITNSSVTVLFQLWTISCEFQIYIPTLLLHYFSKKAGSERILPVAIMVSFISCILYVTLTDINPVAFVHPFNLRRFIEYFMYYYLHPISNTWPYLLSFWLVFSLEKGKLDNFSKEGRKKLLQYSSVGVLAISFAPSYFSTFENQPTPLSKFIFMVFTETANALFFAALVVLLHACRSKSEDKDLNTSARKQLGKRSQERNFDWKTFARQLLKSCYFVHSTVYTSTYSCTRQPLSLYSINYLLLCTQNIAMLFIVAVSFHFLVLSPYSRAYQRFARINWNWLSDRYWNLIIRKRARFFGQRLEKKRLAL